MTHPAVSYYTAARDKDGNIRLNEGKGTIVAAPGHDIHNVREWRDRSPSDHFRQQYLAALVLLEQERAEAAEAELAAVLGSLRKIQGELIHHEQMEGNPVECRTLHGWVDVLDSVNETIAKIHP